MLVKLKIKPLFEISVAKLHNNNLSDSKYLLRKIHTTDV